MLSHRVSTAVARINTALAETGAKLDGDGRPTLTIPPRDLLEIMLGIDPRCFVIPAHMSGLRGSVCSGPSPDSTPSKSALET